MTHKHDKHTALQEKCIATSNADFILLHKPGVTLLVGMERVVFLNCSCRK